MYEVRVMSYGKERRKSTPQRFPTSYEVVGFKKEHYSRCYIKAMFDGEEIWLTAVALQNPITKKWVINGIDSNYNQVVLDVL